MVNIILNLLNFLRPSDKYTKFILDNYFSSINSYLKKVSMFHLNKYKSKYLKNSYLEKQMYNSQGLQSQNIIIVHNYHFTTYKNIFILHTNLYDVFVNKSKQLHNQSFLIHILFLQTHIHNSSNHIK